ncbi:toxin-antitoxin system YwqK family antitoxin [Lewinella sp. JB7]|uniref:toxin-antitoxin system YwqK family antitoxin n=1 Tax=Lewinella sp. JB7 TaxID=2962887 RepID=UPI0020C95EE8|nr:hypothetical protein [Lewinella sp. JB7]MCP9235238.1 hypothetical protein [Lewinella sp. JB7]
MDSLTVQLFACLLLLVFGGIVTSGTRPYVVAGDTATVRVDTVDFADSRTIYVNGIYRYDGEPFTGVVHRVLKGYDIATYSTVREGRLDGVYRSFYASGRPYEVRTYRDGLSTGTHFGYWEASGTLKFAYTYEAQKKEGLQLTWYANGDPAEAYTYHDDRLEGLQQAWRENGSLYRNFIVRDGVRYGLQKSKACFEVSEGGVVLQAGSNITQQQ